ncbi:hypothetical protein PR202_gb05084 [Eleusine coracana subsp. coracana]|uniref:Uncharacterized protein n=1 Tax=Eleusine coracana subsp. coracana TaxID=191504 RepID=A0AAV5E5E2_ELECO|nr:hypothetical protein PR202_gb05084 [Eleusine coracana subsp. coracana]
MDFGPASPENKDRRNSAEPKDRSPSERKDRRCSSQRKDIIHGKERSRSMERPTTGIDARAPNRSSAEPSEKQLRDQHERCKFQIVVGVKKEPPRKVTADEAAAIVMAATRGLGSANDSRNTLKETRDSVHTLVSNDHSSSLGSLSSLQGRDGLSKHTSNSEADTSLTSSGQLKKEGTGIIDDDWIANTIAKAAAVAASKEADSSEATMTKEQKLKAERLRRAKMFASIIKSGGGKMNDLATVASNEPAKAHFDDVNSSTPDLPPAAKEREGSSVPFKREGSVVAKEDKDSDDERNRVRKYRKKHHQESDEDINDSEESYKPSRKRHRSESIQEVIVRMCTGAQVTPRMGDRGIVDTIIALQKMSMSTGVPSQGIDIRKVITMMMMMIIGGHTDTGGIVALVLKGNMRMIEIRLSKLLVTQKPLPEHRVPRLNQRSLLLTPNNLPELRCQMS